MSKRKNSRAIGAREELAASKLIRDYWYAPDAHRTAQRTGLGGTADISGALAYGHIECKKRESMAVYGYLDQAQRDMSHEQYPVLILRANRRPALVSFRIDETHKFVADYIQNYKASGASCPAIEEAWDTPHGSFGEWGLRDPQSD